MTIGVLGLFRPKALRLRARWVRAGAERFVPSGEVALSAEDGLVRLGGTGTGVVTAGGDVTISVPEKLKRTYRGVTCDVRNRGGELLVVIEIDAEQAVASVVAAEMPGAPLEARKAQAVAARTYYTALAPRHEEFDFCDTTHCQLLQDPPIEDDAAAATQGLVLNHHHHLFGAMYFRSCAGRTKTAAQVGLNPAPYPYFAVECPACAASPHRWRANVTKDEAAGLSSESARLALARKYGWNTIASNSFSAVPEGDGVLLSGEGHGHGLGLCQRGAIHLARAGYGFRAILAHYYPETALGG